MGAPGSENKVPRNSAMRKVVFGDGSFKSLLSCLINGESAEDAPRRAGVRRAGLRHGVLPCLHYTGNAEFASLRRGKIRRFSGFRDGDWGEKMLLP